MSGFATLLFGSRLLGYNSIVEYNLPCLKALHGGRPDQDRGRGDKMKVLVIPDVHLKLWMFQRASELMKETGADRAVCLMDIADD